MGLTGLIKSYITPFHKLARGQPHPPTTISQVTVCHNPIYIPATTKASVGLLVDTIVRMPIFSNMQPLPH